MKMNLPNLSQITWRARNDDFHGCVAKNIEKAYKIVRVGFEWVTGEYNDEAKSSESGN
jgi:hypothetical protein